MSDALPDSIQVEAIQDGVRFRLPPRQLGKWRWLGLVPLGFGLLLIGVPLSWSLGNMGLFFVPVLVPFAFGACLLVLLGLLIIHSHSEIEVRGGVLRSVERTGWLVWPRKRKIRDLRRFVVNLSKSDEVPVLGELGAITAEGVDKTKSMILAPGYPIAWLRPFADELAVRCVEAGALLGVGETPAITVVEKQSGVEPPEPVIDAPEQPADSPIALEERVGGVALHVPPTGFRGAGCFLLGFGLLWTGFVLFAAVASIAGRAAGKDDNDVGLLVLGLVFLPVGIAVLLAAIHVSRQRTLLMVADDGLQIRQTSPLRDKLYTWRRDEVAAIRAGVIYSGDDDTPSPALEIIKHNGDKFTVLSGRAKKELDWIATVLRRALGVEGSPLESRAFREQDTPPASTLVEVSEEADGVTLLVPPAGLVRGSRGLFTFSVIWLVATSSCIGLVGFAGKADDGAWPFLIFGLIFWGAGIAMLLSAIQMGRRRAVLAVVGDRLAVLQTGPLRTQRHEWARADLKDIRTGPSGMKVNNCDILELQMLPSVGRKVGLLAGRDPIELAWIATVLRRKLGLTAADAVPTN